MEIIIATALGHYIDIQNGEANALVAAACNTFNFLEVEKFPSIPELLLIFCKFEVPVRILLFILVIYKVCKNSWSNEFPFPLQLTSL